MSDQPCPSGKHRFETPGGATIALWQAQYSRSRKRRECRSYECPQCGGWHLTSKPQWRQRKVDA